MLRRTCGLFLEALELSLEQRKTNCGRFCLDTSHSQAGGPAETVHSRWAFRQWPLRQEASDPWARPGYAEAV